MVIHSFKKCRLFLKILGILGFATVCSSVGDCETFYFNKQLLSSKIPNAIKALEDQGSALSVSGRIKGTEEHWDRYEAVGTCSYMRFKFQTLKEPGWDRPDRGGWK